MVLRDWNGTLFHFLCSCLCVTVCLGFPPTGPALLLYPPPKLLATAIAAGRSPLPADRLPPPSWLSSLPPLVAAVLARSLLSLTTPPELLAAPLAVAPTAGAAPAASHRPTAGRHPRCRQPTARPASAPAYGRPPRPCRPPALPATSPAAGRRPRPWPLPRFRPPPPPLATARAAGDRPRWRSAAATPTRGRSA